jgi:hypothetical protein
VAAIKRVGPGQYVGHRLRASNGRLIWRGPGCAGLPFSCLLKKGVKIKINMLGYKEKKKMKEVNCSGKPDDQLYLIRIS